MGQFDPDYRYEPKWPSQQEIHNQFLEEEIRRRERAEEERGRKEQQRGTEKSVGSRRGTGSVLRMLDGAAFLSLMLQARCRTGSAGGRV